MSAQVKSTIANSIVVAIFTMMIAGIASWNVTAMKELTIAIKENTEKRHEDKLSNQMEHSELGGLIVGLNYDIGRVSEACKENKSRVEQYIRILKDK